MGVRTTKDPVSAEALEQMRAAPDSWTWYVYENQDLGHPCLGELWFLACGPDCTYRTPPAQSPDSHLGIGWRYRLVGVLDRETGRVMDLPGKGGL